MTRLFAFFAFVLLIGVFGVTAQQGSITIYYYDEDEGTTVSTEVPLDGEWIFHSTGRNYFILEHWDEKGNYVTGSTLFLPPELAGGHALEGWQYDSLLHSDMLMHIPLPEGVMLREIIDGQLTVGFARAAFFEQNGVVYHVYDAGFGGYTITNGEGRLWFMPYENVNDDYGRITLTFQPDWQGAWQTYP